jgi:translocation and assembly module TamB
MIGNGGNPVTAIGQFQINDGSYRAYGRTLIIQQGKLIYAGNLLTNPGISLRAASTIKVTNLSGGNQFDSKDFQPVYMGSGTIQVGVAVTGTIDKPRVTLFSDQPGLSQGDILSYLLFGYPQSQMTKNSSFDFLGIASEMYGGPSTTGATSNLQNKLGLDELSVGSMEYYTPPNANDLNSVPSTQQTSAVNIGRNFGHNLSVHYSIGLFQQVQVFSLRYQINKHFAVQTETSTLENGGDLLYQLESAH